MIKTYDIRMDSLIPESAIKRIYVRLEGVNRTQALDIADKVFTELGFKTHSIISGYKMED